MNNMAETIYHYCSLSVFLEIIRNKKIRLSDIIKSNDYMERSYILSNSEEIIYDSIENSFNGQHRFSNKREILDRIILRTKEYIQFYNEKAVVSHVLCFSKNGDKLSQWRAYADDGKGVAIGFDRNILGSVLSHDEYISLSDIIYGDEACRSVLEQELKTIIDSIKRDPIYNNATLEAIIDIACKELIIRLFLNKGLIYKNPTFEEEEEVRLNTNIPLKAFGYLTNTRGEFLEKLNSIIVPLTADYDFYAKSDKIVSYFDISFNHIISDKYLPNQLITGVVIGPKANISIDEMKHILMMNKLGVCKGNVSKSKASYR